MGSPIRFLSAAVIAARKRNRHKVRRPVTHTSLFENGPSLSRLMPRIENPAFHMKSVNAIATPNSSNKTLMDSGLLEEKAMPAMLSGFPASCKTHLGQPRHFLNSKCVQRVQREPSRILDRAGCRREMACKVRFSASSSRHPLQYPLQSHSSPASEH